MNWQNRQSVMYTPNHHHSRGLQCIYGRLESHFSKAITFWESYFTKAMIKAGVTLQFPNARRSNGFSKLNFKSSQFAVLCNICLRWTDSFTFNYDSCSLLQYTQLSSVNTICGNTQSFDSLSWNGIYRMNLSFPTQRKMSWNQLVPCDESIWLALCMKL